MKYFCDGGIYDSRFVEIPATAVMISDKQAREVFGLQQRGHQVAVVEDRVVSLGVDDGLVLAKRLQKKAKINAQVVANIANFCWNGAIIKLTVEAQINLQNECNLRNLLTYPLAIRTLEGDFCVQSPADFLALYTAMIKHVRSCREEGWRLKAIVDQMSDEEILADEEQAKCD